MTKSDTFSKIALINGKVINVNNLSVFFGYILIDKEKIIDIQSGKISPKILSGQNYKVIDCNGFYIGPGLIETCAFINAPEESHQENIESLNKAAIKGGYSSVCIASSSHIAIDNLPISKFFQQNNQKGSGISIFPIGAITSNLEGKKLSEFGLLNKVGIKIFSDGKKSISSPVVMKNALNYAKIMNAVIASPCLDEELTGTGVAHECGLTSRMGLPGIPKEAELIRLERDLRLLMLTKGKYHASCLSCAESVDIIKKAKEKKQDVTASVTMNNLFFTCENIHGYNTAFKLSPPLREEADKKQLLAGVLDGTIDIITSHHDPQEITTKNQPFEQASSGSLGLETSLSAAYILAEKNEQNFIKILSAMTSNPAKRYKIPDTHLKAGTNANCFVFDPKHKWKINNNNSVLHSSNTAFNEQPLEGKVKLMVINGKILLNNII